MGAASFYRVNYPPLLWAALGASVADQLARNATTPYTPMDRGQLIDDAFTIAEGGIDPAVTMGTALSLSGFLKGEASYETWIPAVQHLSKLNALLWADDGTTRGTCVDDLAAFGRTLVAPIVAQLGFDVGGTDPSPLNSLLRSAVLGAGSLFNEPTVVTTAMGLWSAFVNNNVTVPVNLQSVVFTTAARYGGAGAGLALTNLFQSPSTDAATSRRMLSALSSSMDVATLRNTLTLSMVESIVRKQDTVGVIAGVAGNPMGRPLAWLFLQQQWTELLGRYGQGGFALSNLLFSTSASFTSAAKLAEVKVRRGGMTRNGWGDVDACCVGKEWGCTWYKE